MRYPDVITLPSPTTTPTPGTRPHHPSSPAASFTPPRIVTQVVVQHQELSALFTQTDRCHYCSLVPFRHLVMPVLFRTIYACGLRLSEARLLLPDDVDLDTGVLQLRDAKGGKDRQVPVSEPLRVRLAAYHAHLAGCPTPNWFFPGRNGQPLTVGNIERNFRRFLWHARIPHGGPGRGPRVHDLRHKVDGWIMRPAVVFPLVGAAPVVSVSA